MRERRSGAGPRTAWQRAQAAASETGEVDRGKKMHGLKLALFAFAAVLAGAATFAGRPAAPADARLQALVRIEIIEDFLADSRRYLGL